MTPRRRYPDGRTAGEGIPKTPGWWIQWCDRNDWRPVQPDFAAWVVDQLIDGEKLVLIDGTEVTA